MHIFIFLLKYFSLFPPVRTSEEPDPFPFFGAVGRSPFALGISFLFSHGKGKVRSLSPSVGEGFLGGSRLNPPFP